MSVYLKLFSARLTLKKAKSCGAQNTVFDVYLRGGDVKIGDVNLTLKADKDGLGGVVDVNIDAAYDGQGLSIEALKRVRDYAYDDLGLVKLYASAPNKNLAAEYTLRRVGFALSDIVGGKDAARLFVATNPLFSV